MPKLQPYVPVGGAGRPLAQRSDFYAANPYQDDLTPFAQRMENLGTGYLDQTMRASPFAGGNWDSAMAKWSDNYPDITDPKTIEGLRLHMANLSGDRTKMLTDAARTLANTQAGRRGAPVGGVSQEASAYKTAMDTAANQYRGDYTQSMEYLRQKALYDQQTRQALADLLKAQLGAGTTLTGQALSGLEGAQSGRAAWTTQAGNAYGADVTEQNQLIADEQRRLAQQLSEREARTNAAAQAGTRADLMARLRSVSSRPSIPLGTSTPAGMDYGLLTALGLLSGPQPPGRNVNSLWG